MTFVARATLLASLAVVTSCGPEVNEAPPAGEVLVVVDTDMPVPRIVSRLRIDLYTMDGVWFESRDVGRIKPSDWPASFGVYLPDPSREMSVMIRLRAYREGEVHDYRGERFVPVPPATPPLEVTRPPRATNEPRLVRADGADVTPPSEPDLNVTIDRLAIVRVRPGMRLASRILLRGACIGTMADVAGRRTCIDTEKTLAAIPESATTEDRSLPPTVQGTFVQPRPCTATTRPGSNGEGGVPLMNDEACIEGGLFIYGSKDGYGSGEMDDVPRRIAILPPFRIDRHEVTVARMRDAIRRGFSTTGEGRLLQINDQPLPQTPVDPNQTIACTYSSNDIGREAYPVNCISWELARDFCMFEGGDLPTEVQWEYAAAIVGRDSEARYAWVGDDELPPGCDRTIFGRGPFPFDNECLGDGKNFGTAPVGSRVGPGGDVTPKYALVDMTGNLSELMRDAFASMSANCWQSQPLESPACIDDTARVHATRGGSWFLPSGSIFFGFRQQIPISNASTNVGLRCVRPND